MIVEDTTSDSFPDLSIITGQKEKIEITTHFKNPVRKIVEILQTQNPDIKMKKE